MNKNLVLAKQLIQISKKLIKAEWTSNILKLIDPVDAEDLVKEIQENLLWKFNIGMSKEVPTWGEKIINLQSKKIEMPSGVDMDIIFDTFPKLHEYYGNNNNQLLEDLGAIPDFQAAIKKMIEPYLEADHILDNISVYLSDDADKIIVETYKGRFHGIQDNTRSMS